MRKRAAGFVLYVSSPYRKTGAGSRRAWRQITRLAAQTTVVFLHWEIKNFVLNRQPRDVMHNTCQQHTITDINNTTLHIHVSCQSGRWITKRSDSCLLLVAVAVVVTSLSGIAYMEGQKCPEEMRNSTRLLIRRDPSLPCGSYSHFIDWGTTLRRLSLPAADGLYIFNYSYIQLLGASVFNKFSVGLWNVVKRSDDAEHCWMMMLMVVDALSRWSRFSNSVVGVWAVWPSDFKKHLSMVKTQCPDKVMVIRKHCVIKGELFQLFNTFMHRLNTNPLTQF